MARLPKVYRVVVQFWIRKVVAGESITCPRVRQWMESRGIEVADSISTSANR